MKWFCCSCDDRSLKTNTQYLYDIVYLYDSTYLELHNKKKLS